RKGFHSSANSGLSPVAASVPVNLAGEKRTRAVQTATASSRPISRPVSNEGQERRGAGADSGFNGRLSGVIDGNNKGGGGSPPMNSGQYEPFGNPILTCASGNSRLYSSSNFPRSA